MISSTIVIGVGSYLPGEAVTNADLERHVGRLVTWVCEMLGSHTRYLAYDLNTGKLQTGESNAHMAYQAAIRALENAGRTPKDIDLIALSTSTPDYPFPATVYFVQEMLGISSCQAMELRAGCSGMAQALCIANDFISSGRCQTALIIGSELASIFGMNLISEKELDNESLINLAMFGDGAGALVLTATKEKPGLIDCFFNSVGLGRPPGVSFKTSETEYPLGSVNADHYVARVKHNFSQILTYGPELVLSAIKDVKKRTSIAIEDYRWVIPPQVNGRLISQTIPHMGLSSDRVFTNYHRVGNTSSASIYIALDQLHNEHHLLKKDDLLLLLPCEATKWIYGGAVIRWSI